MVPKAEYELVMLTDMFILILDQDGARSVTNDAARVVRDIDQKLGGIGKRSLFYRDSAGHFDQLLVKNGHFDGFAPCSEHQQQAFSEWISR